MFRFLPLVLVMSLIVFSCSGNSNKTENKDVSKIETADTTSTAQKETKPKSKYETAKALEEKFKEIDRGKYKQVLPQYIGKDGEGIYCYFIKKGKRSVSLSLHVQYSKYNADLFDLEVNGETMSFEANKTFTSDMNQVIVENSKFNWYAKMINEEDEEFLRKVGETGKATLHLKSKDSGKEVASVELTEEECQSLLDAIDYYIALNGAKIPKKGMVNIRSY